MMASTPHARGSTFIDPGPPEQVHVYPACAGIHPCPYSLRSKEFCLPRMRGDPPYSYGFIVTHDPSTPHARGSTPS